MKPTRRSLRLRAYLTPTNLLAIGILAFCALAGWWLLTQSAIDWSQPTAIITSIQQMGLSGVLLYIGFLVVAIVIGPIPSTPVTIAAGAVWGSMTAGIYATIGVFLGSLAAYFIGRTLGRSAVRALLGKVIYLSHHRGQRYLGILVFVMHLIPVLPYDLMSYGAGISGLSFPLYAFCALLGIIPCTFFLTFMGSSFSIGLPIALSLIGLFLMVLIVLPWGIRRYNWLGLRDIIRVEHH
ncbi:TVP38/TMEM64 family protein [Leptolyngbya ohadii]|uniref:TVP38/TMEM64 family protein n=1 Tax=Leptolyngbya ohadii TaxID=1962290 RepID=UPI001CECB0A3|nr:VTT domain-containing protein [Leptolyngbya ohadii]